jgi:hypothetical protein
MFLLVLSLPQIVHDVHCPLVLCDEATLLLLSLLLLTLLSHVCCMRTFVCLDVYEPSFLVTDSIEFCAG